MTDKRLKAERATLAVLRGEREPFRYPQAVVGDDSSGIYAPRPGWVYVRLHGDPDAVIEVFNPRTALASGMVVDLERINVPGAPYYQIRGVSSYIWYGDSFGQTQFYQSGITGNIAAHAAQHRRGDFGTGGFDPLDIEARMLMPLRAQAQATPAMTLYVGAAYYYVNSFKRWTGGNSPAFTAPAMSARYDLLYLGNDDQLHIQIGTAAAWGAAPDFPSVPAGSIPIAFVYLTNSTTTLTESNIVDARVILTAATSASGTGDASADAAYVLALPFAGLPSGIVFVSGLSMRGPLAARPSNAVPGAFYWVTGDGIARLTRWSGNAWEDAVDNNVLQTGVVRGNRHRLNFSGTGVQVSDDDTNEWIDIRVGENPAGGDLGGVYPSPTVLRLQGRAVSASAPNSGQALVWNGSQWIPSGISGGGGGSISTDSIWQQTGDLVVGTGVSAASILASGSNGSFLMADNTKLLRMGWAQPFGQIANYPRVFESDIYSGNQLYSAMSDVVAFDVKESINSRILHLRTVGASKDQRVRLTLGAPKSGAFDVQLCFGGNLGTWVSTLDEYIEILLTTAGGSQIAIARLLATITGIISTEDRVAILRVGGSGAVSTGNRVPSIPLVSGEAFTLRFVRDDSNIISYYVAVGNAPMFLGQIITTANNTPYTNAVSGTLSRIEIATHSPSGPSAGENYIDVFVDYVAST